MRYSMILTNKSNQSKRKIVKMSRDIRDYFEEYIELGLDPKTAMKLAVADHADYSDNEYARIRNYKRIIALPLDK